MSAPRLADLVAPGHTALVTQECQGAVLGPQAALTQLADAARPVVVPNIDRLCRAARAAGVPVLHCVAERRPDGAGSNLNARLFHAMRKIDIDLTPGSAGASVIPEIAVDEADFVLRRFHGIGPMAGTDLDPLLRNLGISTIIGVGVSVNVAMTNFVMDAVNTGYTFVLPRDAVAGVPAAYAEAVIDNTLALLATVTTTVDVLAAWDG